MCTSKEIQVPALAGHNHKVVPKISATTVTTVHTSVIPASTIPAVAAQSEEDGEEEDEGDEYEDCDEL
jgi:hypothetical protein